MLKIPCCPNHIGKHGKKWESTKKEIETKTTKTEVIWFVDEDEVVQRILEIIIFVGLSFHANPQR